MKYFIKYMYEKNHIVVKTGAIDNFEIADALYCRIDMRNLNFKQLIAYDPVSGSKTIALEHRKIY